MAIYLRNELFPKKLCEFSNGVVEFIIMKSSILKTLFICLYRPPDTKNQEWSQALETLSEQIELAQAHSNYQRIVMDVDVNFKDCKWNKEGYLDFENT